MPCLVLDAMGVIFQSADDVAELLVPFISRHDGEADPALVDTVYRQASLGEISADDFWHRVGLSPALEDAYLDDHRLNAGLVQLLALADDAGIPVWCLSNDVGRWSQKLRRGFDIESRLHGSIISGDVGVRKPDPGIYQLLIEACGHPAEDLLFVDDREQNRLAARDAGIESMPFDVNTGFAPVAAWLRRHGSQ